MTAKRYIFSKNRKTSSENGQKLIIAPATIRVYTVTIEGERELSSENSIFPKDRGTCLNINYNYKLTSIVRILWLRLA